MTEKRCTRCILSENFPRIKFDEEGVCNFCNNEIYYLADGETIKQAEQQILEHFERERGKHEYDAILCYSGGKDSTYTLKLAVEKYGLRILAFTLDNSFISTAAFENMKRVVEHLGIDHITVKPSRQFIHSLIKATSLNPIYNPVTLGRISANCNACISLVNLTALRFALEKEVPFIIAGFTLGQIPANSIIYKNNYTFLEESREPVLKKFRELSVPAVDKYFGLEKHLIENVERWPYNINLLCLEDISEEEIVKQITPLGWTIPGDVDGCSSNCRLNSFNNFVHMKMTGFNPYELELSHLIRKGQLSREEALKKITDQPEQQIRSAMADLGISDLDLENLESFYKNFPRNSRK